VSAEVGGLWGAVVGAGVGFFGTAYSAHKQEHLKEREHRRTIYADHLGVVLSLQTYLQDETSLRRRMKIPSDAGAKQVQI
jgi:TorA maturation chaperone TorD